MVWALFLNNQTTRQTTLGPTAEYRGIARYVFIAGRDLPIIITDEGHGAVPQNWAVGVNDGVHPVYQLGYEGGGNIRIILRELDGVLQYNVKSGFNDNDDYLNL